MPPTNPDLARWFAAQAQPPEAAHRDPVFALVRTFARDQSRRRAAATAFAPAKTDAVRVFDDAPDAAGAARLRQASDWRATATRPDYAPRPLPKPVPS